MSSVGYEGEVRRVGLCSIRGDEHFDVLSDFTCPLYTGFSHSRVTYLSPASKGDGYLIKHKSVLAKSICPTFFFCVLTHF